MSAGFFEKPQVKQSPSKTYVAVGSDPFRALTVALFDYYKSVSRVSEVTLKLILEQFYAQNPQFKSAEGLRTVQQSMMTLIQDNPRRTEVLEKMALVLRQIVAEEILAHPLNYRKLFEDLPAATPVDFLLDSECILPREVFATAAAKALGIRLTLIVTMHGKELPAREVYGADAHGSVSCEVEMQAQEDRYFPAVKDPNSYAYVSQLGPAKPFSEKGSVPNATIADIKKHIAGNNSLILKAYHQMRHRIETMFAAGDITKQRLVELYVHFLPAKEVSNVISIARLEHLHEKPVTTNLELSTSEYLASELIDALASSLSIGQINPDAFFDSLEESTAPTLG